MTATGNGLMPLPIKRAEWILKNILDSKLPPPPVDINLEQYQQSGNVPLHERLKQPSQNPKCFSCHKRMDPIAVVMNAFNTIDAVNHNNSAATVKLNDKVIRNFAGFKDYLKTEEESIAGGFIKSLLRYSLGRELLRSGCG
ncbi:MAG: DUF1588 domain-containing protein [Lentisphaerales bacterium]|nr:DUF1588 domain-containing protein [Lentisphaerales bacterium]